MSATATTTDEVQPRHYVILQAGEAGQFTFVGDGFEATSPEQAIRRYAESAKVETGSFLAIPERSWRLLKIQVKTERKVVVS